MDEKIIGILVDRIKSCKINPLTEKPFELADIKMADYKAEVSKRISQNQPDEPLK